MQWNWLSALFYHQGSEIPSKFPLCSDNSLRFHTNSFLHKLIQISRVLIFLSRLLEAGKMTDIRLLWFALCPVMNKWWRIEVNHFARALVIPYSPFTIKVEVQMLTPEVLQAEISPGKKFWCLRKTLTTRFNQNGFRYGDGNFTFGSRDDLRIWPNIAKK